VAGIPWSGPERDILRAEAMASDGVLILSLFLHLERCKLEPSYRGVTGYGLRYGCYQKTTPTVLGLLQERLT